MSKHFQGKEYNTETGEIRNTDPKWKPFFDASAYITDDIIEGKVERKEFEEKFFNFITEFQANLREKYNASFDDIGRLLVLMTYTSYRDKETGKHYLTTDNHTRMSNQHLSKIWKLNSAQTRNVKSSMKKKGLIGEDDESLYISDEVMIRGKVYPKEKKELNYYVIFDKPIRDLYDSSTEFGKRDNSKYIGILLSVIPFIKVSTSKKKQGNIGSNNSLVLSEWDEKKKGYKPMSKKSLAIKLGISRPTIDNYFGLLNEKSKELTGRYLLYEIKPSGINDLDKTIMVINPYYTYTQGTGSNSFKLLEGWIEEVEALDTE